MATIPSGDIGVATIYTSMSSSAKLLELDEAMLAALVSSSSNDPNAQQIYLKGTPGDQLVLTTRDATYSVTKVETSNSMFLCRPSTSSAAGVPLALEVQARLGASLQVTRVTPSAKRLQELLLQAGVYSGPTEANDDAGDEQEDYSADKNRKGGGQDEAEGENPPTPRSDVDNEGDDEEEAAAARAAAATARSLSAASMGMTQYAEISGLKQYGRTQAIDDSLEGFSEQQQEQGEGEEGDESGGAGRKRPRSGDDAGTGAAKRARGSGSGARGYTFEQLLSYTPMSEAELKAGLVALQAIRLQEESREGPASAAAASDSGARHGGEAAYRLLDEGYTLDVLDASLTEAQAAPGGISAVDVGSIADALSDRYPPFVTAHVLRAFSTGGLPSDPEAAPPSGDVVCLDFRKVAVAKGLALLRGGTGQQHRRVPGEGQPMPVGAFMPQWVQAVPGEMVTRVLQDAPADAITAVATPGADDDRSRGVLCLSLLSGHALRETPAGGQATIRYFSHADMEDEPAKRFAQLFGARPRWTEADITPFVAPLASKGRSVADLLLTHARTTLNPDNSRFFSER